MIIRSVPRLLVAMLKVLTLSAMLVVAKDPLDPFKLVAAGQSQSASTSANLAGTSWQLVKFQSSDDKTITPNDRTKYTIAFRGDGRAAVRLDCNRGTGSYESKSPNQLEFGRFTITLMMCAPGSLHNRIARDLPSVRSYIIKDGHLFLSLMADGGIYEFEPLGSAKPSFDAALFGKKWKLTEITGTAVPKTNAYIELDGETKRFSGDGGCNRISGSFKLDGPSLRFSEVISTRRACLDTAMQQVETDFLKGLEETINYETDGSVLRLFRGDRLLLTFGSDANQSSGSEEGQVTGTVTYLQRSALPPNAVVEVKLLDVSRADAPSVTIAEQMITSSGKQVPFAFELRYDPGRINERGRYVVQARILVESKLVFTNTEMYPVLTGGHGDSVKIIVKPVKLIGPVPIGVFSLQPQCSSLVVNN